MIEVFKTNVQDYEQSRIILDHIHTVFSDHTANFDLDDCDKILRIKCTSREIQLPCLMALLNNLGCAAEVLPE